MNEHSGNLVPSQYDAEQEWAIEPAGSPEEFGFPAKPTARQTRSWMRQQLWLEAFAKCGSIGEACAITDIPVPTAEHWDTVDYYGFKRRKAWAAQMALGKVETEINRRAIEGVDHPVIHQGVITDTYKQYPDNLLMFRAKRLDPSYRDNYDDRTRENVPAQTVINIIVPPGAEPPQQVVEGGVRWLPAEDSNSAKDGDDDSLGT